MKNVLAHVARRKLEFSRLTLFSRLADKNITPLNRLIFMPGNAFFIMAFGDLNRYLLRSEIARDDIQASINIHTHEDDHHWLWFLEDIEKLGWNSTTTTTASLRSLWGEDNRYSRLLVYELCAIVAQSKGVERLAVVEAIEETGNVVFSAVLPIAEAIQLETGQELRYMGKHHFELESGHLQNCKHAELASMPIESQQEEQGVRLVDRVFDAFSAWSDEAVRHIDREVELSRSAHRSKR